MKRFLTILTALALALSVTACGNSGSDTPAPQPESPPKQEVTTPAPAPGSVEEPVLDTPPSGIWEDGMGDDPMYGEGIGEVIALTEAEQDYMLSQTTNTWLELTQIEKDDLVVLVGRWLEDTSGFIVPDYDELILMLDRQMEQYFRNGVDEGVLSTVKDIYGLA